MLKIIYIIAGGAAGALSRYALGGLSHRIVQGIYPIGTLTVNLAGSFLIGFLWALFENTNIPPNIRTFIFIGFLGSFTTFSTYTLETLNLLKENEIKTAFLNILYNNIFGLILVFAGFLIAKTILNLNR